MAKVVLVQNWMMDSLGLLSISAVLKKAGHTVKVFVKHEEKDLVRKIASMEPDLVGFSCTTGLHSLLIQDAMEIKKLAPGVVTVMGGSHATFNPEVVREDGLDIICQGEGEDAFLELCTCLDEHKPYNRINNLWVKDNNGNVTENPLRPLIQDLDTLPFPDRDHYDDYGILKKMPNRFIATGRGCVYNCSFCSIGALKSMYKGKGKFIRRRSPRNVLEEAIAIKKNHYVKCFSFVDDDMLDNHEWVLEFFPLLKKHVGVPFTCLGRFDNLTDEVVRCLKDSGCYLIELGIDSGNEQIRQKLLNKCLPDAEIIKGARILKKYGLKFRTFNIIGLPGETVDDALDTLNLNKKIQTDFPTALIWQPYTETQLAKKYTTNEEAEVDNDDFSMSLYNKSIVKNKDARELENLQKLFPLFARSPISFEAIKKILKIHIFRPFYTIIYLLIYTFDVSNVYKVNIFRAVDWGLRMRKLY